jgi:hypothetical protein
VSHSFLSTRSAQGTEALAVRDQDWWIRSDFPRTMFQKDIARANNWPATPGIPAILGVA